MSPQVSVGCRPAPTRRAGSRLRTARSGEWHEVGRRSANQTGPRIGPDMNPTRTLNRPWRASPPAPSSPDSRSPRPPRPARPRPRRAPRQGGPTFKVTATVSNDEPEQGTKIKIKGTVKPLRPGAKVRMREVYVGDEKWKLAGTDVLNKKGKFKFNDEVDSVRVRQYRVVKPAGRQPHQGQERQPGQRHRVRLARPHLAQPGFVTAPGETSSAQDQRHRLPAVDPGQQHRQRGLDLLQHRPQVQAVRGPGRSRRHLRDHGHRARSPSRRTARRSTRTASASRSRRRSPGTSRVSSG